MNISMKTCTLEMGLVVGSRLYFICLAADGEMFLIMESRQ